VVEEIVVTATKRAQAIQEVPVAVTAIGAERIKAAGITDARDLVQVVPSLFLTSGGSEIAGAVARIRGVGTTGDNPGLESSVALFVDGVYRNRTNVGLGELGEVERIEVLRGPQGTLFGRNASAGLIAVTTAGPSEQAGGYGEIGYGNYDAWRLAAGFTGPVGDTVAARLDGVYQGRDGFLTDRVTGEDYNTRDRGLLRGQLLLTPGDDVRIRLIADYAKRDEDCCAAITLVRGPSAAILTGFGAQFGSGGAPGDDDPFDRESATSIGRGHQQDVVDYGLSAELGWDFDAATLTAISAWREWRGTRAQDTDYMGADLVYRDFDSWANRFQTWSQELRLNGQSGPVDWLVGAYAARENLYLRESVRMGNDFARYADALVRAAVPTFPGYRALVTGLSGGRVTNALAGGQGAVENRYDQESTTWALFTHNIVSLTDRLDLTLGARYTDERKSVDTAIRTDNPACPILAGAAAAGAIPSTLVAFPCLPFWNPATDGTRSGDRDESELTGSLALSYSVGEAASVYGSYARGYKAGGYNLDRAAFSATSPDVNRDLQFDPETVDSFELGAKLRSADRRLTGAVTLFHSTFEDFQLNTFNGISFVVVTAPEVVSKGVEVEATAQPIDGLLLAGGVTYADTRYADTLPGAIFAPPSAANPAGGTLWQLPGRQITNAPEWVVTASATYEVPVTGAITGLVHIDARYTGAVNTGSDLDLEKVQDGVLIINGRIGLAGAEDGWRMEGWVRNIFDKEYVQIAFDATFQGSGTARNTLLPNTQTFMAFPAEPRTYGITLRRSF
jgi:outer membrane receptor protein involved in Fe transport